MCTLVPVHLRVSPQKSFTVDSNVLKVKVLQKGGGGTLRILLEMRVGKNIFPKGFLKKIDKVSVCLTSEAVVSTIRVDIQVGCFLIIVETAEVNLIITHHFHWLSKKIVENLVRLDLLLDRLYACVFHS